MSLAQRLSTTASDRSEQPDQIAAVGGARPDELETPVRFIYVTRTDDCEPLCTAQAADTRLAGTSSVEPRSIGPSLPKLKHSCGPWFRQSGPSRRASGVRTSPRASSAEHARTCCARRTANL